MFSLFKSIIALELVFDVLLFVAAVGRDACSARVHGSIEGGAKLVYARRGSRISVSHGFCPQMIQASSFKTVTSYGSSIKISRFHILAILS